MKKQKKIFDEARILRQKAEESLNRRDKADHDSKYAAEIDMLKLLHELEVHQLELEMQNEELVAAKEKAEAAEEKFTELYDFAPSGYVTLSKDGKILELNFIAAKMLGKERSQLMDKRFEFFTSLNTQRTFNQFLKEVFSRKIKQSCEVVISTEGNLPIYVNIDGIVSQNNKVCFLSLVDISERIKSKNALQESENKFKNIISDMQVGVLLQGSESEILMSNPKALELLGLTENQLLGKTSFDPDWNVIHEDGTPFPGNTHPVPQAIATGQSVQNVIMGVYHPKKQDRVWLLVDAEPQFSDDGKVSQVVCSFIDITKLKKAEEELRIAKEKAEESDRLKSAFLSNMSHEIRTPMNGVLGFANLLKDADLSGDERMEYLELIERSGIRLLNIINDIIDISKIESGLMNVNYSQTNINEKIEYFYKFFRPEAEAKGIKLSFKTPLPEKEAFLLTDSEKVCAIFTNLVKNAIKYTEKGTIEFGYFEPNPAIGKLSKPDELQFYAKDTGIGVPKDRQDAIFERFIQADICDKMARQGAGLGLAITKAFVEMLGGKIWVESEEGKGSTFYFTLPNISKPEELNEIQTDEDNKKIKKLKILVADDDDVSKVLISYSIKQYSKEILFALKGNEAVEICRNNPDIDLILMDIQMPDMNGYDATRQIRQFNKDVVIIAQTAYALSGDREKSIEAGCNDYIAKPIESQKLEHIINKYFHQ